MDNSIVDKLKTLLAKEESENKDFKTLESYQKAISDFNKLLDSGLVKKRGYTLMTLEESYSQKIQFNTQR